MSDVCPPARSTPSTPRRWRARGHHLQGREGFGARPSDLVAVFGIGGLGHLAVQYAQLAGATVVAVDRQDARLTLAEKLGAAYTVNSTRTRPRRGGPSSRGG